MRHTGLDLRREFLENRCNIGTRSIKTTVDGGDRTGEESTYTKMLNAHQSLGGNQVPTVASSDAEECDAIEEILERTREREASWDPRGLIDILAIGRRAVGSVPDECLVLREVGVRVDFVEVIGVRQRLSHGRRL